MNNGCRGIASASKKCSSHSNNPRIVISWLVSIVADISTPNTSASCHFIFRFMISGSNAPAGKSKIQFSVLSEKVDAYFAWAKQKYSQVTHNSTIGKALAYSINQEEYLRVFLSDGNVPMDNNYAEQAIRPFTIGRKNFVMIESSTGAKASAILYSLVETAKANMLNTFEYFNLLLTEIPQHMDDKDLMFIDDLLPWSPRIQKECPSRYKKT